MNAGAQPIAIERTRSQWAIIGRRFLRHRLAVAGAVVLLILMLCCFGASWIARFRSSLPRTPRAGYSAGAFAVSRWSIPGRVGR